MLLAMDWTAFISQRSRAREAFNDLLGVSKSAAVGGRIGGDSAYNREQNNDLPPETLHIDTQALLTIRERADGHARLIQLPFGSFSQLPHRRGDLCRRHFIGAALPPLRLRRGQHLLFRL